MKELFKTVTELAPEFGFQLNEDANLEADVMDRLNRAASLDEVDTVSFGLETDDGKIVKVYVAEKDAEKFEKIMSQALGKVDDIEEAINLASKEVEIIDVEWPDNDEDDDNPDDELTDDGSEVLNPDVYDNAQANKELEQKLKPRVENMSYGERFVTNNVMTEGVPGGIASRLTSPNQQLILQAVLELGIPEVVLDRSPYRATIIHNIRELAMQLQRNSSMKQALRVFVKRTIDQNAKEPDQIEESLLTEGNADVFWSAFESALKALDKSRKGLDAEALFNDSKYQNLKKRSLTFLNSKVGTTLRTKLNSLAQAVETMNTASQPVAEAMTGDDAVELVTRMFNMADQSQGKKLAAAVLNTIAAKTLLRRIKQGVTSLPSAIKSRLDAVEQELNREPVAESLKDILASLKTKDTVTEGANFICRVKKGNGSFIIWQNGHYNYTMTEASQPFKKVKTWPDSSLDDVKAELKKDGYKGEALAEATRDPEIIDAAKAVGTVAELTDAVYKRVEALMPELKRMSDGDLASKLARAKGEEKFAIRVALKVIGRRVDDLVEATRDPEIIDAAKAVGTVAELTDAVYNRVKALMPELKKISDGDLASKLARAKGEEKFAIRVALKVIGRRVDENAVKAKVNDTITEADEVDKLTIEATDDGVKVGDAEFIEENLERLLKALANRETVSVRDTNDKKYIVSPRGRSAVLKQVGAASRIELNPEQVNDLLNAADGSKE
jgi:hypothetical protein